MSTRNEIRLLDKFTFSEKRRRNIISGKSTITIYARCNMCLNRFVTTVAEITRSDKKRINNEILNAEKKRRRWALDHWKRKHM